VEIDEATTLTKLEYKAEQHALVYTYLFSGGVYEDMNEQIWAMIQKATESMLKEKLKTEKIDYFVFGHRHLPMVLDLDKTGSLYINLGDWISYFTYGVFDGQKFDLLEYK